MSRREPLSLLPRRRIRQRKEAPSGKLTKLSLKLAGAADRKWGWHRLPLPLSIPTLIGLRATLRRQNLFDPAGRTLDWGPETPARPPVPRRRSIDGSHTNLTDPDMGKAKSVFGRNVPIVATERDEDGMLEPDPRTISKQLLARDQFLPATSLNLLVAAWVQFEVHDWMSHGENQGARPWVLPLAIITRRRCWSAERATSRTMARRRTGTRRATGGTHRRCMAALRVLADALRVRSRGHLRLENERYPYDPPNDENLPDELRPARNSWWAGLAMFHTLFAARAQQDLRPPRQGVSREGGRRRVALPDGAD